LGEGLGVRAINKNILHPWERGWGRAINISDIPRDKESAQALALKQDDRTRKEFEKWAVLTYSNNQAIIQQKKGKDQGIDGIAYFRSDKYDNQKIIFQIKSGNVKLTYEVLKSAEQQCNVQSSQMEIDLAN